jgi:hypothetical protein
MKNQTKKWIIVVLIFAVASIVYLNSVFQLPYGIIAMTKIKIGEYSSVYGLLKTANILDDVYKSRFYAVSIAYLGVMAILILGITKGER